MAAEEHADQSVQDQVSTVQFVVLVPEVGGVQDRIICGAVDVTPTQSNVMEQVLVWLPFVVQEPQSEQDQISAVQEVVEPLVPEVGGMQDCIICGAVVVALGQSNVMAQVRAWVPFALHVDQSAQDQVSAVQEEVPVPELGGVQDCVSVGIGVVTLGQSKDTVQPRDWVPLAEQADHSAQAQVSAVQEVVEPLVPELGGAHDCIICGAVVVALGQSNVMAQVRAWVPFALHVDQSAQDQVSVVQEVVPVPELGGVQDCVSVGIGVVTLGQSKDTVQPRDWVPFALHVDHSAQVQVSSVQEIWVVL